MFSTLKIFNKNLIILRDDLLGEINGNKARKLRFLSQIRLPYSHIISYGSSQSNAMAALSIFCKERGIRFSFVCARRCEISANHAQALQNGTVIYYAANPREFALKLHKNDDESFFINEGVCDDFARFGFFELASEIARIVCELDCDVFLPSGTYTSALYIEKYLSRIAPRARVFSYGCVSGKDYLAKQCARLNPASRLRLLKTSRRYRFAELYEELYILACSIEQISFELLYDAPGLASIYENLDLLKPNILYIHQGGLLGSQAMLARYERKFQRIPIRK